MRRRQPPSYQDGSWPEMEKLEASWREETRLLGLIIGIGMIFTIVGVYSVIMLLK